MSLIFAVVIALQGAGSGWDCDSGDKNLWRCQPVKMSTGRAYEPDSGPASAEEEEAAAAEIARVVAEARRKAGLAPLVEPGSEFEELEPGAEQEPEVIQAAPELEPQVAEAAAEPELKPEVYPEPRLVAVESEPEAEPEPEPVVAVAEPELPAFDLEGYVLQVGAYIRSERSRSYQRRT